MDNLPEVCACVGPKYGEPYCYCQMIIRKLPLSMNRVISENELREKLDKILNQLYAEEPTEHETNPYRNDTD